MERELTVRHVFVGYVERQESGIRNAEFETLSNATCLRILYTFILFFFLLDEAQFALQ